MKTQIIYQRNGKRVEINGYKADEFLKSLRVSKTKHEEIYCIPEDIEGFVIRNKRFVSSRDLSFLGETPIVMENCTFELSSFHITANDLMFHGLSFVQPIKFLVDVSHSLSIHVENSSSPVFWTIDAHHTAWMKMSGNAQNHCFDLFNLARMDFYHVPNGNIRYLTGHLFQMNLMDSVISIESPSCQGDIFLTHSVLKQQGYPDFLGVQLHLYHGKVESENELDLANGQIRREKESLQDKGGQIIGESNPNIYGLLTLCSILKALEVKSEEAIEHLALQKVEGYDEQIGSLKEQLRALRYNEDMTFFTLAKTLEKISKDIEHVKQEKKEQMKKNTEILSRVPIKQIHS